MVGVVGVKQQVYHASLTWLMRAAAESQDSSGGVSTPYALGMDLYARTHRDFLLLLCLFSLAESSGLQSGVDGRTVGGCLLRK